MSKILVTKPFQAPFEEITAEMQRAWDAEWLTNNGPLLKEFEQGLNNYLGTQECAVVSNGTVAIQVAMKALEVQGEVITTPFSYVATTSSIVWEGCVPVFVDVDPKTFNIDPTKIEGAITSKTTAILATHVFGVPCHVEEIQRIADAHGLKVIYDAAHCFGSTINGNSVLNYGHLSTLSLHATKLMHSVEGGAIFINDSSGNVEEFGAHISPLRYRVNRLRNFGHFGPEVFDGVGINAKNSEMHAAIGLVNLRYADAILADRARQHAVYDECLAAAELVTPEIAEDVRWNKSYYPVVFRDEKEALFVKDGLEEKGILARRYFYPALNTLPYIMDAGTTPNAHQISSSILCLPLYYGLENEQIAHISYCVVELCNSHRS
jgi:dTDP-4-amino-4,6-dideoxygalactose transaminase